MITKLGCQKYKIINITFTHVFFIFLCKCVLLYRNALFTDKCRSLDHYACAVNPYEESCRVRCIMKKRLCDRIAQCPLGDDEHNCGLGKYKIVWPLKTLRMHLFKRYH